MHGEDDIPDIEFIKRVLDTMNFNGEYHTFSIGQDIIDWALKQGKFSGASHTVPNLILLDISLPGLNGKDILKTLRADIRTMHVPIVIMSGSISERDFQECIALGCNGYIQKNESLDFVSETCQYVIKSWINLSRQTFI